MSKKKKIKNFSQLKKFLIFSCRNTQAVLDKCMLDNLEMDRPEYGYFCRAKIHQTDRPAPAKKLKKVYEDATPGLPDDYPRPPAKFGSRVHYMM